MRTPSTLAALATVALLAAPATATEIPDPPALSEDEEARLAAGKLVVHKGLDDVPWKVLGVIEIDAAPATVWDQILDMETRVEDNGSAESYEVYRDTTEGGLRNLYVTMTLRVVGREIVYHNHYRVDAAGSYMWFTLDPEKESDLVRCDGSYQVIPSPQNEGGSRLIYVLDTEPEMNLPDSIRVLMATKGLKQMLTSVKARAEAARSELRIGAAGASRNRSSRARARARAQAGASRPVPGRPLKCPPGRILEPIMPEMPGCGPIWA